MNNKISVLEYLRTILLTMFFALALLVAFLAMIQHQVYEGQKEQQIKEDTLDSSLIGILIDKNKYLESQYPNKYRINMKLGALYELKKDYKNAEAEYKTAIEKAPYYEYEPEYKLALMYIGINRLDDAQITMDNIEEKPDRKLIRYKADIYNRLGDKYYNKGDYEEASAKYQKSLFYFQIIKSKEAKLIKGNLASAYVYLAQEKVNQMKIDEAINYLQRAKALVNAPIIKYKLALLLMNDKPDLAYQYFEDVFKTTPEIINYDEYYKFLMTLAAEATMQGDLPLSELYQYKIQKLKEYYKNNILSIEDLVVEYAQGSISFNPWMQKYNLKFELKLKNKSKYNFDSLYLEIIFRDGDKIINNNFKQVIDKTSVLNAGAQSPLINIETSVKKTLDFKLPEKITVDVYASKLDHSCKLLLKTVEIQEQVKNKPMNKFVVKLAVLIQKIMSKIPAFLYR